MPCVARKEVASESTWAEEGIFLARDIPESPLAPL